MATTGHENESINVRGLKSSLQAIKTKYIDDLDSGVSSLDSRVDTLEEAVGSGGSIDTRISNAINALDSSASQSAGNDGLALSITEEKGKVTSINGSIAANTYDAYGAASAAQSAAATDATNKVNAAKSEIIGNATSDCDTLGEAEAKINANTAAISNEATVRANAVNSEATRAQAAEQLLQEQYNALTQSDIIVGVLPSSGTKNKIYRVPGTNTYSDYMWNGSSFVKMATYDNAIDDEPIVGSNNLAKSGGIASKEVILDTNMMKNTNGIIIPSSAFGDNGLLKSSNGQIDTGSSVNTYVTSNFISIVGYNYIKFKNLFPKAASWCGLCYYGANKDFLAYSNIPAGGSSNSGTITRENNFPSGAMYIRFSSGKRSIEEDFDSCHIILSKEENLEEYDISNISKAVGEFNIYNLGDRSQLSSPQTLSTDEKALYTVLNSRSTKNGFLSKIKIYTNAAGSLTFYIGLLDQRNMIVNERSFIVNIPSSGENEIDVSSLNLFIKEGEQIFFETNINTIYPVYNKRTNDNDGLQGMYTNVTRNWVFRTWYEDSPTAFPYGIKLGVGYTIKTIQNSMFALAEEFSGIEDQIQQLNVNVASAGLVYDNQGNPYKIMVSNGQLIPKSTIYQNVIALGNSLTCHEEKASIGWYGKDYSMASTRKIVSWTSQLEKILKHYNNNAVVIPFNIYEWEYNPQITPATITYSGQTLEDVLTNDIDCVIFRAGENNAGTEQTQYSYELALTNLINYIKTKCPIADIIITSLMWPNSTKDTAFYNVSQNLGLKYVNTPSMTNHRESLGDICKYYDESDVFPIISGGVAAHTNDYGFYLFANTLASAFGYVLLNELFNININSNISYYIKDVIGVKDSVITIQTYGQSQPNVVVQDSSNNSIQVNHLDISSYSEATWASYFIMPNSDVEVTIN